MLGKLRRLAPAGGRSADHRRDRRRQGGVRRGRAPGQRPRGAVRGHQLRRHPRRAWWRASCSATPGARTRRRPGEDGADRAGGRRDAVPGRDRRDAAERQTKLLRFLQNRECCRWGRRGRARWTCGSSPPPTARSRGDADGIGGPAACGCDLAARLGAEPLMLPPLRDRPEDIGTLALALGGVGAGGLGARGLPGAVPSLLEGQRARAGQGDGGGARAGRGRAAGGSGHLPGPIAARVDAKAGARGEGGRRSGPPGTS